MVHDLDPFAWQISGDFGVRWYGLSYMAGFIFAYFLIRWLAQRQKVGLTPNMVGDFITYCAIGTLVGGRLGYCLFYSPDLFWRFKSTFPFWGVLAVNEGGMASHGGMIGLAIACAVYAAKYGVSRLYLFDLICVAGPVGVFFGRIANFINGELVGRPSDPNFAFGVKFPSDIYLWPTDSVGRLPELAPVIEKVPGFTRDQWLEWVDKFRFDIAAREHINDGLVKIVEAIQNGNAAAKEAIAPLLITRHPSQLYGALGEGLFLFIFLFILWYKPRKPGVIAGWFFVLYAIVRIVDEHFRMPDAHIGYQLFDLTRGQWLSIGMLVVGLVFLFIWSRRETLPTPGWGQGHSVKLHRR